MLQNITTKQIAYGFALLGMLLTFAVPAFFEPTWGMLCVVMGFFFMATYFLGRDHGETHAIRYMIAHFPNGLGKARRLDM